jgi:hypothetical protein
MRRAEPESLCRSDKLYPASCGRRLPSGRTRRQSNPSNKAANIAGDIRITPGWRRQARRHALREAQKNSPAFAPVVVEKRLVVKEAPNSEEKSTHVGAEGLVEILFGRIDKRLRIYKARMAYEQRLKRPELSN